MLFPLLNPRTYKDFEELASIPSSKPAMREQLELRLGFQRLLRNAKNGIPKHHIFKALSRNKTITPQVIEEYEDKPWNWNMLSDNPNITHTLVEKHIRKNWDWYELSKNPNISLEFIFRHKPKIMYAGVNPNITIDFVLAHDMKRWDWKELSEPMHQIARC